MENFNKIKLDFYLCPDRSSRLQAARLFRLPLPNGLTVYKPNKKEIDKYMVRLNNELNDLWHGLNLVYISLFSEYRKTALVYDFSRYEMKLSGVISLCEKMFYKIPHKKGENQAYFVFHYLTNIINALNDLAALLIRILKDKKNVVLCKNIQACSGLLGGFADKLANFGKNQQKYAPLKVHF